MTQKKNIVKKLQMKFRILNKFADMKTLKTKMGAKMQ